MTPTFLSLEEVIEIHRDQISRYGGSCGIRDRGLLQSAVAQPSTTFDGRYLHADLFEMAAAYLFHLVQNHPFVDGNKRVGAVAALVFLLMNDQDIETSNAEFEGLVMSVACGAADKATIASFFQSHADR